MTELQKRDYKKKLLEKGLEIIEARISSIRSAMNDAQLSANNEEKSSAGDKYETSRTMSQLQKDMHASRLSSNIKEMEDLLSIDCSRLYDSVKKGSLVSCDKFSFFISAGLGKIIFENETILLVSPVAPIIKILGGKKRGDKFVFNKEATTIKDVF